MTEIRWAEFKGYKVSTDGQVVGKRGYPLKLYHHNRSYLLVSIADVSAKWGNTKMLLSHLVLNAFVGPRPDGLVAVHANNDPTDCRLENLSWGHSPNLGKSGTNNQHLAAQARRDQTECKRGHALEAPNLVESNPNRNCKACCRTHAVRKYAEHTKGEVWDEAKFQEVSDQKFLKIIDESSS